MHLAWANQVLAGELPVRDFVDPGMPLTYLASVAAQLLLGRGAWAEAVLSFTLLSAGATLTCYLARRASGSLLVGLIAALVQVMIAPRLYSAPKIVLPLCAVWAFWRYADQPSRRSLVVLAACTATAFLVRHDHGVYIWAAASVLFVHLHWPKGAMRVATYSGCVALMLSPFFAYVQWNEGIVSYLRAGLAFTEAEYRGPAHRSSAAVRPRAPRVPQAPVINIRWAATVDRGSRARVEAEHSLEEPTYLGEQTWQYRLADQSSEQRAELDQSARGRGYGGYRPRGLTRLGRQRDDAGAVGARGQSTWCGLGHGATQARERHRVDVSVVHVGAAGGPRVSRCRVAPTVVGHSLRADGCSGCGRRGRAGCGDKSRISTRPA